MIEIGEQAPDFELRDQTNQPVRLSDLRGKKAVLLVFYPMSFTGTCQGELCDLRDDLGAFVNEDVQTLALSVDSPPVHRAWADQQGYEFPLLADFWPHGEVARSYGVFDDERGIARRATVLIDRDGEVAYTDQSPIGEPRDQERWKAALSELD